MKKYINVIILTFTIIFLIPLTALAAEKNQTLKENNAAFKKFKGIAHNEKKLYVGIGDKGNIRISNDKMKWDEIEAGITENLNDVIYDGEKFLAVGEKGLIFISINGKEWNIVESHTNLCFKSITYRKGYGYIILGENDTLLYSKDSLYWQKSNLNLTGIEDGNWKKIIYGNNKFIILGDKNILLSEDRKKWDIISNEKFHNEKYILNDIILHNKEFIISQKDTTAEDENLFMSSVDGYNWVEFYSDKILDEFKEFTYKDEDKNEYKYEDEDGLAQNVIRVTEQSISIDAELSEINLKDYVIYENNRETFYLQSKSSRKVQYRIFIYDLKEEKWEELTEGYSRIVESDMTYIITPHKKFKKGLYMVSVWVKGADSAGIDSSSSPGYDNYSVVYLKCDVPDYDSEKNLTQKEIQYEYILNSVTPSIAWAVINKDNKIGKKGEKVEILMDKQNGKLYRINKDGKRFWIDGSLVDPIECPYANKKRLSTEESEIFVNSKDFSSSTPYFIWVDIERQIVNIFKYENEKYNLIKVMLCASGKVDTPTVRGEYIIEEKGKEFYSDRMNMGAKYWVRFYKTYLFHSYPIDERGNILDTALGKRLSHGCIRLSMENSKWIYNNISYGSKVWIN